MPVMMDVSNHDSDGFEFDVVVGEEEGGGWGRQLLRGRLFRPLGSDKSAILFTAIGSLHSQSIDFTTPNPVMPCRSMAFDELAWCRG